MFFILNVCNLIYIVTTWNFKKAKLDLKVGSRQCKCHKYYFTGEGWFFL